MPQFNFNWRLADRSVKTSMLSTLDVLKNKIEHKNYNFDTSNK